MKFTRQQTDGLNAATVTGKQRPAFLGTLGIFLSALMVVALTSILFAQPVPATFVNPTFFNGASVIPNHSPTQSYVVVAGDFNNDGIPDLLTLADDGVSLQLGTGNGGFGPDTAITSPFACNLEGGIVTGDFNNDGNLDFAIVTGSAGGDCNFNPGTLWIYLGNGAGGFTLEATYTEIGTPANNDLAGGLIATDLRGNGHLDILAIDPSKNGVDVFLGNGDGTFQTPTLVSVSQSGYSGAMTAGDVNHDGKPDLVVASNVSGDGIYVLIGNGDGTFQTPAFYQQGSNSGAMAVAIGQLKKGDNGDVVMGTGNGAYVYMNNGDGTFKTPPVLYGPSWINSIVITDINGDGKNDLVVSSYSSSAVWTMLGNGKGGFTTLGSFATDGYPNNVVLADFNGDKKLDFATSNNAGQWETVALGNGDGTFRSSQSYGYTWSGTVSGIATADMNNDGILDIVEAGGGTGVGITVLLGSSHGGFGSPISTAVGCGQANRGGVSYIALGDVNGDHKVDVVANMTNSGGGCPNNEVAVLLGAGKGKFKAPVYYSTGTTQQSYSVTLADLRGDGRLDILTSNGDGSLSVLLNNGKGVYGTANVIAGASGTEAASMAIGDFNNDGKLDLAVSSWDDSGSFVILTGKGDGTFTAGSTYNFGTWEQCYPSGGSNPYWIGAADLNQDGKLDLALAVQYSACDTEYSGQNTWGAALVYTGNGDGTFNLDDGPWVGGVDNSGIALGDFNGDGMIDVAVAGNAGWTSQDWVTILLNNTQPVSVSPLNMNLGSETVGKTSKAQTVIVTNDESATLAISGVGLGGSDPGDFGFKSACKSTLLAGANCSISVTFTPTASGKRTATLQINDGAGTQSVALTGTGK